MPEENQSRSEGERPTMEGVSELLDFQHESEFKIPSSLEVEGIPKGSDSENRERHFARSKRPPLVQIEGEEFLLTKEDGYIFLSHPDWSITGFGENLAEAEIHLKRRIQEMYKEYLSTSATDMTVRALDLRSFLLRVYGTR
jgi:hypothetical protein